MEQGFTLKKLKSTLYLKVSDYFDTKEMFENIKFKLDILRKIISYLNSDDSLTYNRNLEVSSMVEENINSYIQNNSRKGIR